jgi:hypothetical protein
MQCGLCKIKSESRIFEGWQLQADDFFSYMSLNTCWFLEISFQLSTTSMRYECHLHQSSGETCIKATKNILFNTGCYWELLIGNLSPKINMYLMTYKKKNRLLEVVTPRKSYFHFWSYTNLGVYFPMQTFYSLFALRLLYNSIYSIFKFVCIQNLRCLSFRSIWVYSRGF